jgi:proteasome lid subunit RPN8/RPN11
VSKKLELPKILFEHLFELARKALPNECVGFLAGISSGQVSAVFPLVNVAGDARSFYVAQPSGVIRTLKSIKNQHLELVGIYHSHPCHEAVPSKTDLEKAAWEVPYLILDVQRQTARAWSLLDEVLEIPVVIQSLEIH